MFLSTRSGAWVLSRSSGGGYPFNMMLTRRCNNFIARVLPSCFINWRTQKQLNHENYGLSVAKGYLSFYFMGNLRFIFTIFTNICKVHVSGVPYMHRASAIQSRPPFSHPSFFSLISSPPLVATTLILASTYGNESATSYLFVLCTSCNILQISHLF